MPTHDFSFRVLNLVSKEDSKFGAGILVGVGTNTGAYSVLEFLNSGHVNVPSVFLTLIFLIAAYILWKS